MHVYGSPSQGGSLRGVSPAWPHRSSLVGILLAVILSALLPVPPVARPPAQGLTTEERQLVAELRQQAPSANCFHLIHWPRHLQGSPEYYAVTGGPTALQTWAWNRPLQRWRPTGSGGWDGRRPLEMAQADFPQLNRDCRALLFQTAALRELPQP